MTRVAVTARQSSLLITALITFVLASCFPYIFLGPVAAWIALGVVCFGLALLRGDVRAALRTQRNAVAFTFSWLALVIVMFVLDLVGYDHRNILAGPILNLLTLLIFIGMFVAALRCEGRAIIQTLVAVTLFQSIIAISQFLGSTWAWDFATNLLQELPGQSQTALEQIYATDVDFADVGRVRGTHVFVHIFNAVQSALVGICIFMAFNPDKRELPPGRLRDSVRVAAITGTIAVLLSFSRSGILALAGTFLIALLIQPSLKKSVPLFVFGLGGLALLFVLDFSNASQFHRIILTPAEDGNAQIRFEHISFALENFIRHPLIGASGIYDLVALEIPIHSVPFRFLNDYGLLGFLPYTLTCAFIVAMSLGHVRSRQPQRVFWGGASLCLVFVMLVDGGTHSSGFLRRDIINGILFGLLIGQASRIATRVRWENGRLALASATRDYGSAVTS